MWKLEPTVSDFITDYNKYSENNNNNSWVSDFKVWYYLWALSIHIPIF